MLDDVANPEIQREIAMYSWPEMQYITLKLSGQWTNIDLRYSSFNGYPIIEVLNGIHFAGLKPWNIKNKSLKSYGKFEDYQLWFATYMAMIRDFPELNKGKLKRIHTFISDLVEGLNYQFTKAYMPQFKQLLK